MRLLLPLLLLIVTATVPALADDDFWDEDKIIHSDDDEESEAEDGSDESEDAPSIPRDRLGMYFGNGDEFVQHGATRDNTDGPAPTRRSQLGDETYSESDSSEADSTPGPVDNDDTEDDEAAIDGAEAQTEQEPELRPLFGNFPEEPVKAADTDSDLELVSPDTETSEAEPDSELELPADDSPGTGLDALKPVDDEEGVEPGKLESLAETDGGAVFEATENAPEIKAPVVGDQHVWSVPPGSPGLENYSTYPAMEGLGKGKPGRSFRDSDDAAPPLAPAPGGDDDAAVSPPEDADDEANASQEAEQSDAETTTDGDAEAAPDDDQEQTGINRLKTDEERFYE